MLAVIARDGIGAQADSGFQARSAECHAVVERVPSVDVAEPGPVAARLQLAFFNLPAVSANVGFLPTRQALAPFVRHGLVGCMDPGYKTVVGRGLLEQYRKHKENKKKEPLEARHCE